MVHRQISSVLCATLLVTCAVAVVAQSGRRARKPTPQPVATPEATPSAEKPAEKKKPGPTFVVGIDRYSGFSTIPLSYYSSVARGCAERLDDATAVKVEVASTGMNRSDAVIRAKAEKEAYVVWLQLKVESFSADPTVVQDLSQLYVEYEVLEPTTAKRLTSGHTYQQGYRKGGIVVGPGSGRGNAPYTEYLLKQAAGEAGERILSALKIRVKQTVSLRRGLPAQQPSAN